MNEPFNGDEKCWSSANSPGYKIPLKDGKNMLTGSGNEDFTITELEVWEVEYLVIYFIKLNINIGLIEMRDRNRESRKEQAAYIKLLLF